MIAERISTLITRVDHIDKNEILGIHDLLNEPNSKSLSHPLIPFRQPDHSITPVGFKGRTQGKLMPGEASLAHGGVLFMDELNFFQRDILRLLQAVLDHRRVQLKKGSQNFTIPADFLCVTGFNVSESKYYPKMIPPSLIDRFDVSVFLDAVDHNKRGNIIVRNSKKLRTEINEARTFQLARNSKLGAGLNSRLDAQQTYELCKKTKTANLLFKEALEANNWSFRRQLKVLQLARSIADLGFAEKIDEFHLSKALTWAP
jgi:magnesium chelatase family protein